MQLRLYSYWACCVNVDIVVSAFAYPAMGTYSQGMNTDTLRVFATTGANESSRRICVEPFRLNRTYICVNWFRDGLLILFSIECPAGCGASNFSFSNQNWSECDKWRKYVYWEEYVHYVTQKQTSWVCRAKLEFNSRLGWGWVGFGLGIGWGWDGVGLGFG